MEQRVVLITGAGRGVGRCMAETFARAGDALIIADIVLARAEETAAMVAGSGAGAIAVQVDVGAGPAVAKMVAEGIARFGRLDVLINAAGSYGKAFRATHETPDEEWDSVLDSNLKGSFLCAKYVIPHMMRNKGGRIINFASNAGRSSSPLLGATYTSAKTGIIGLTRHLAVEYAPYNILVNTIAPGPLRSDRVSDLIDERMMADLATRIPLGRLGEFQDVADVVFFMASDSARYMTGAILDVNGGFVLA
ncbi:MAG: SDR family oxidoreductase [Rhizobiales bacterium]|nr:SDR family oxidoreductase [Hyphomicrobiales bacterium]MBN9010437.1 SDR family oxidoreductase [Hyphomicrobiales bacterium]